MSSISRPFQGEKTSKSLLLGWFDPLKSMLESSFANLNSVLVHTIFECVSHVCTAEMLSEANNLYVQEGASCDDLEQDAVGRGKTSAPEVYQVNTIFSSGNLTKLDDIACFWFSSLSSTYCLWLYIQSSKPFYKGT